MRASDNPVGGSADRVARIQVGNRSLIDGNGTTQAYMLWTSDLPRGKRERWMVCVQRVNRPGSLGDKIHNGILFWRIVVSPDEGKLKGAYHSVQKALYCVLATELEKETRLLLRLGISEEWISFEPGAAVQTLGTRREQTLDQLRSHLGAGG